MVNKCKEGYKLKKGKCVKIKLFSLKSNKLKKRYSWIFFWVFSSVLFVNNTTQLLINWVSLSYAHINLIAWVGIILSLAYVLWIKE